MTEHALPEPLRTLEPCLAWSLPTERERTARHTSTPMEDSIAFQGEMSARLEEIITYPTRYPYAEMPEDTERLCDMAPSLMEVCNLVEIYKNPDVFKMVSPDRFVPYE